MNNKPVYGWAMNFGKGYKIQDNFINKSSEKINSLQCENISYNLNYNTNEIQSDGQYSNQPPFYTLKPIANNNCPKYNYILPNTYPYLEDININKKYYWYYPYDKYDWNKNRLEIPKPSF
jgi:hypothetical protein